MKIQRPIRFKFSPQKALAAIHWMVTEQDSLDLHTMLKSCYFADKDQLNKENRPIFGATYKAMRFGPVPLEIYEMAKGDPLWLAELGISKFPWSIQGYNLSLRSNEPPDLSVFSETDFSVLERGFRISKNMTFDARTAATHGKDWQSANLGYMRYEDMLDDAPDKDSRIADLVQAAPFMRM